MSETKDEKRAAREQAEALEREQYEADFKWFVGDKRGRRLMYGLLNKAGIFESSFSASDTERTAYREGRRSTGLDLLSDMNRITPRSFIKMLEERIDARNI